MLYPYSKSTGCSESTGANFPTKQVYIDSRKGLNRLKTVNTNGTDR